MPAASPRISEPLVRTFRAANVRAALDAVKASLGDEAVILHTRDLPGNAGFLEVEVTAAVGVAIAPPRPREEPREPAPGAHPSLDERMALETKLLQGGVEVGLARELVKRAAAAAPGGSAIALEAGVRAIAARRLVADREPWVKGGARVIALVGPPGVGKTTSVAKIAARAMLDSKLKVALITIDTWRIAASDQLLRYGQIMRIPAYVARDRASLEDALKKTASADFVVIDTAGRSSKEALETQATLLRSVPGITLVLTLAANTSASDLATVADRYRAVAPARAIITKTDETTSAGGLLSAFVRLPLPVTCVTCGQRVPEDIGPATSASLQELVFGAQRGA